MCIIAIKPKNVKMFTDEEIKTMFANNPDGAGFVYNTGTETRMKKGYFKVAELLEDLHKVDFTNKDLLLHFRIATSGNTDVDNCHPFNIKQDLFFAHNGILSDYTYAKDDKSDTQHFNEQVLKKINCYDLFNNKTAKKLFKELIGTNKLAFIDSKTFHIVGDFVKNKGRIYSNTSYKEHRYTYSSYGNYHWSWDNDYYNDYYGNYYGKSYGYSTDPYEDVETSIFVDGYGKFNNANEYEEFKLGYLEHVEDDIWSDGYQDFFKCNDSTYEIKRLNENLEEEKVTDINNCWKGEIA